MSTQLSPAAATASPKEAPLFGTGFVKVVTNAPFVLKRYTTPEFSAPVSSAGALTSTRSLPTAATDQPKLAKEVGLGFVKEVITVPLCATPTSGAKIQLI